MSTVPAFRLAALSTGHDEWRYWILRDDESSWAEGSFNCYASKDEAIEAGRQALEELKEQWAAISGTS
jgi:hypothetical protein